jgi:hypothetical protein
MGIKLSNNAFATLAAGINSSATSITVTSGQGARFPTLSAGDYFYATLIDTSNNLEIVKCTARSTDVLTVVRGQESTTARAYSTGDRIEIRLTAQTFLDATGDPTSVSDKTNTSTGYFDVPAGTTAQRPGSPGTGMIRFNTNLNVTEIYNGSNWQTLIGSGTTTTYNVQYLVVAGGGGGGSGAPGGGGGGGMIEGFQAVTVGSGYTVTVGGGGAIQANGANSVFGSVTATGGGAGGSNTQGATGGSGGGSGQAIATYGTRSVDNQGSNGGAGNGGGGGAGGPGQNGYGSTQTSAQSSFTANGQGGMGRASQISGQTIYYAGGGSGYYTNGAGGSPIKSYAQSGGGGDGFSSTAPRVNSGGGGYGDSSAGGSGIVVIAYEGPQRGTGGTVTSVGGKTIHTFTSSGTFTA